MDRNALAELLQALESRRDAEERRREERYTALIERDCILFCQPRALHIVVYCRVCAILLLESSEGNAQPGNFIWRGRQPIDIRLSVMAVTRRGLPIESITGAEALVESCGDGEPQKKKRATEQSISSSRGETLGSPVYER
ncbi:UNVERIFIED_CONTAM: hypothetical protein FKN15_049241 [Acipenser sinensis]